MRFRKAFLRSIKIELYHIEDLEKKREGMALLVPPQRQLHPQRMLIGVHMSKVPPASVCAEGGTLTWSGLTGDRELLYQWCRGIAVVVGVQHPPVRALPKENPVEKQKPCLRLRKEAFCQKPTPLRRESSLRRRCM